MALVETKVENKIGWLILNRPEKLNAFSREMLAEFGAAVDTLSNDPAVSLIVLRGEGRAFSVGYDVGAPASYAGEGDDRPRRRTMDDWVRLRENIELWLKVWRSPKPVIASIQGYCMGGATMLAVCCDITVIAEDATVGWPSVPLGGGLIAPVSIWLLGPKKAKEMSYIIGSKMSGIEAKEWGWANYAVPADELLERTTKLANRIAKTPAGLLVLKKRALNRVMDTQGFTEAILAGAEFDAIAHDSVSVEETATLISKMGLKDAIAHFVSDSPN